MSVESWATASKKYWLKRLRPERTAIEKSFRGPEMDTGPWLASFTEFEITADSVRQLSVAYHYLPSDQMNFFLLPFLRANLVDHKSADVSPRLAAEYINSKNPGSLAEQFPIDELKLISIYFDLIGRLRGWSLLEELRAAEKVKNTISVSGNQP